MHIDSCSTPGLRFSDYARSLVNTLGRAAKSSDGALTIGIFGKWGTGKTTLMRCVEKEFLARKVDNQTQNKTIWFSPWKYDTKEKIWNALIQSILAEIEKDIDTDGKKACHDLAWLMRFYAYEIGRELALGWVKKQVKDNVGFDLGELKKISQTDSISEMYRNLNRFEEDFKLLVSNYVGPEGRLVIFIDDLDRCLPTEALTVLEALKLYLDRANCIFVIGLDGRTIEQAVREKYSSVDITGKDYIEKMIHLNFFIPENDPIEIEDLLRGQMNELAHHIDRKLWALISIATGRNLRRIKQYLIAWNLQKELLPDVDNQTLQEVAIFLLVQMYYPKFYEALSLYNYSLMNLFFNFFDAESEKASTTTYEITIRKFPEVGELWQDNSLRTFCECLRNKEYLFSTESDTVRKNLTKMSMTGQRNS